MVKFSKKNFNNIHMSVFTLAPWVLFIDIESLQNRLLGVCYVPANNADLSKLLFLLGLLAVLIKQTRQVVRAFKQSILLRCLWCCITKNKGTCVLHKEPRQVQQLPLSLLTAFSP